MDPEGVMPEVEEILSVVSEFKGTLKEVNSVTGMFKDVIKDDSDDSMDNSYAKKFASAAMYNKLASGEALKDAICRTRSLASQIYTLARDLTGKDWTWLATRAIDPSIVFFAVKVLQMIDRKVEDIDSYCMQSMTNAVDDFYARTGYAAIRENRLATGDYIKKRDSHGKYDTGLPKIASQTTNSSSSTQHLPPLGFSGQDVELFIIDNTTRIETVTAKDGSSYIMENGVLVDGNAYVNKVKSGDIAEENFVKLGNSLGITASVFRAKPGARPLGYVNPAGFARGTRTIAGTLLEVVLKSTVLGSFLYKDILKGGTQPPAGVEGSYFNLDQLPPFDLLITFRNEYGGGAFTVLKNCEFISNDMNITVDAMQIIGNMQFMATDMLPITPLDDIEMDWRNKDNELVKKLWNISSDYFTRLTGGYANETTVGDIFSRNNYATMFDNFYWRNI